MLIGMDMSDHYMDPIALSIWQLKADQCEPRTREDTIDASFLGASLDHLLHFLCVRDSRDITSKLT